MEAGLNHFHSIKKSIRNNYLGLIFKNANEASLSIEDGSEDERTRTASIIKEQRLRHRLMATKAEQDMRQLNLGHQERVLAYQQQLSEYQQQLNDEKTLSLELKETLANQAENMNLMRDYFESKLAIAERNDEVETLREHYESEMLLRIEEVASEYKTELKSRDIELLYRSEHEEKLRQEILALQTENRRLAEASSDEVLHQLNEAGVNFIFYHPGAGHLTIQAADVHDYLSNTAAYVARQCGVNEHLYCTWLDHFYSPTCQHELANGEFCDCPITRVDDPSQFIIGESDRCLVHQTKVSSVVSISKNGPPPQAYSAKT